MEAAISVGVVGDAPTLDLDYDQDSSAAVDMNVVATGDGRLIEVQGTGERRAFSRDELDELLDLALTGIAGMSELQREVLHSAGVDLPTG